MYTAIILIFSMKIFSFRMVICVEMKFGALLISVKFKFLEKNIKKDPMNRFKTAAINYIFECFLVILRNVTHKTILFYQLKR